jgi:thioredoxin 1
MTALKFRWLPLSAVLLVLGGMALQGWLADEPPENPVTAATPIAGNGLPTLVELGMNTCASCKAMQRVLETLRAADGERLRVLSVNVMEQGDLAAQWKVRAIPTQILLDGEGREIGRHLGYLSADAIGERFAAAGLSLRPAREAR